MIHVAFWVFAVCSSIGFAYLVLGDVERADNRGQKVRRALAAAIAFIGTIALFYMIYWASTTHRR